MTHREPDTGRAAVSLPWLLAAVAMIALIWGNSLVPGEGSSSISMAVVDAVRGLLDALSLPSGWVTNFLVRKTAHFTEYAVLGVLVSQALDPGASARVERIVLIAGVLVLVPSVDEAIQLSVAGRSGQVADVLLDCCGAAFGSALCYAVLRRGRAGAHRRGDG